jgi:putative transposase
VESDRHFLTLVRYVERNAKRAGLVKKAKEWPWSSVHVGHYGTAEQKKMLSPWPTPEKRFLQHVKKLNLDLF